MSYVRNHIYYWLVTHWRLRRIEHERYAPFIFVVVWFGSIALMLALYAVLET